MDAERTQTTTATYTADLFMTLDGFGSFNEGADWGGYWSKQGPELLDHRAALFAQRDRLEEHRLRDPKAPKVSPFDDVG